jgi:hypothetical protein
MSCLWRNVILLDKIKKCTNYTNIDSPIHKTTEKSSKSPHMKRLNRRNEISPLEFIDIE